MKPLSGKASTVPAWWRTFCDRYLARPAGLLERIEGIGYKDHIARKQAFPERLVALAMAMAAVDAV